MELAAVGLGAFIVGLVLGVMIARRQRRLRLHWQVDLDVGAERPQDDPPLSP
jgi:hypothetical protein